MHVQLRHAAYSLAIGASTGALLLLASILLAPTLGIPFTLALDLATWSSILVGIAVWIVRWATTRTAANAAKDG